MLRVHTERIEGEQYYPDFHHDSLSVYTTDSVMNHLQTDSILATTSIDRWYAPGYRYPVLETRLESIEDAKEDSTEISSDIILYNAPYCQEELEDEYNETLRDILANMRHSVIYWQTIPWAMVKTIMTVIIIMNQL